MNTILVAILGILAATILGFVCGVLRLSDNFLIKSIVGTYVEFTRNVPVLLQIIFWWVDLLALPKVRESISLGETVFLNNRGVNMPSPIMEEGSGYVFLALIIAVLISYLFSRWNNKEFEKTGKRRPAYSLSLIHI